MRLTKSTASRIQPGNLQRRGRRSLNHRLRRIAKGRAISEPGLRMEVVVRRRHAAAGHERFAVSARLPLPGRDVCATAVHADLHSALVQVIRRLVEQSYRRKRHPQTMRSLTLPMGSATNHRELPPEHIDLVYPVAVKDDGERNGTSDVSKKPIALTKREPGDSAPHVVVAFDGGKTADAVARVGASWAAKKGARVTLLHVLAPGAQDAVAAALWPNHPEQLRQQVLARMRLWAQRRTELAGAACRVTEGLVPEEVVRYATANKADLIVMGRSDETRWFGQLTARTAERVVQHAGCPVLVVGRDQERWLAEPRKVLLPTDLSEQSLEALPWARRIAEWYGAEILLVNVQDPMGLPGTAEYARFSSEIDALREEADARLNAWCATHLPPGLRVETRVMEGEPADSLCRLAEATQTDLIVMSTHGAKGWVRKWLGGTTEKVLRKASSSVLVVPHRQPAPAELEPRSYRITPESAASWDTPWTAWDYHGRT